jgi:hypothetical protein
MMAYCEPELSRKSKNKGAGLLRRKKPLLAKTRKAYVAKRRDLQNKEKHHSGSFCVVRERACLSIVILKALI